MWGKIMIAMYRLWLHGLYGLYGPRCPLSPERPLNLITHSLTHCEISNIRHTKSQNLTVSRLVLQLSLCSILKPGVKSRMKMLLEQRRQALLQLHLSDQQLYCLLSSNSYWRIEGTRSSSARHGVSFVNSESNLFITFRWLSARLQYLLCISNGNAAVLH